MAGLNAIVIGKELPESSDIELRLLQINCHLKCYAHDLVNTMSRIHQLKGELDLVLILIQDGDEFWTLEAANAIRESYSFPILFILHTINSDAIAEEIRGNRYACFMSHQLRGRILLALEDSYRQLLPEDRYEINQHQKYFFLRDSVVYIAYNNVVKITFDDIRYLVKKESGIELYTTAEKHDLKISQGLMAKQIQKPYFVYCQEGILINVKLVDSFTKDLLTIGGQEVPMQEPYREQVFNMFRIFDQYNT
ncbi:MAG: LytTR family transcriptional regulator DNA-binding domain-containing protein [Bacteroidota bacterium]